MKKSEGSVVWIRARASEKSLHANIKTLNSHHLLCVLLNLRIRLFDQVRAQRLPTKHPLMRLPTEQPLVTIALQ